MITPLGLEGSVAASSSAGEFRLEGRSGELRVFPASGTKLKGFRAILRRGAPARIVLDKFLNSSGVTLLASGPLGLRVWYKPDARPGPAAKFAAMISGLPISGFGSPPKTKPV